LLTDHELRIVELETQLAGMTGGEMTENLDLIDYRLRGNDTGSGYLFTLDGDLKVENLVAGKSVEAEEILAEKANIKEANFEFIKLEKKDNVPDCDEDLKGGLYFSSEDNYFYGCDGEEWKKIDFMEN
jgi:hypothetical protein